MILNTRIAGIPCFIETTRFIYDDEDVEIRFDVLDRRGRAAPWLERKLTERMISDIECEIIDAMRRGE